MKGTEKQIVWAEDIKAKVLAAFEGLLEADPDGAELTNQMISAVNDAEYAGDIIDIFGWCSKQFNGDWRHDIKLIAAEYRTNPGNSDAQRKIMCK